MSGDKLTEGDFKTQASIYLFPILFPIKYKFYVINFFERGLDVFNL